MRLFFVLAAFVISTSAMAEDKITFGLDYVPQGQHAPFYVARDKGFFKTQGLDVDIQRGFGSADAVKRAASGTVDISFGDTGAVILSRGEGLKVKLVAMIYVNAPFVILVREDAGIKTPKDLMGKTIASPVGSSGRMMFPVLAKAVGIDPTGINWLSTDGASLLPVVLAGRAVGMTDFYGPASTSVTKAKENGTTLNVLKYSDYGVDIYSNGIIVRDEMLTHRPDVVRRFIVSLREAYKFTFEHPEEAADILVAAQPQLIASQVVANLKETRELNTPKTNSSKAWGFMEEERMELTRAAVVDAFSSDSAKKVAIQDCFTNDFLK